MQLIDRFKNISIGKKIPVIINEVDAITPTPENQEVVETYWVNKPFSKVKIIRYEGPKKNLGYFVEDVPLDLVEKGAYREFRGLLEKEINPPKSNDIDQTEYVITEVKRLSEKYNRSFKGLTLSGWEKILYHISRDLTGYGDLDTLIRDPAIEDISCNGVNRPIYIWHQKYESIQTNIMFKDELLYNNIILKLAHLGGKHISTAYPMLDAMLPEKHRLAATFMREVSSFGSSFCIRKFRAEPFTIVDLIKLGTIDAELAAYFWLLLENKMNITIIGGTGAGKTSMLNALCSLMDPNDKVVSVEEVNELNFDHENWVQLVSRRGFKFGESDTNSISLFDLVKLSLRYRPDYIIVGEIRGEEAYVLFQAMATGHGGICTMHADSLDHAIKRLTSPPMNVSPVYIPLMNACIYLNRTELPDKKSDLKFGRRIRAVTEVIDFESYRVISDWSPTTDTFETSINESAVLSNIATLRGCSKIDLLSEIEKKESILNGLVATDVRDQHEISQAIHRFQNTGHENDWFATSTKVPIGIQSINTQGS